MQSPPSFLRPINGQDGVAALEFGIIAPVMVIILVAAIEIGLAVRDANRAQEAAATGAAYALQHGWDPTAIANAVLNGSNAPGLTASPAPVLYCGCPGVAGVSPAACGTTCPDGAAVRQYVRVSASVARTSVLSSTLPLPSTLTRQSIARLQ